MMQRRFRARLRAVSGAAGSVISLFGGKARLLRDIPMERWLALAQQLAYVDSVAHELETFGVPGPGADNSSFSPEDLPSNLFGTLVAAAAFGQDGGTNAAITHQFDTMLGAADAQSETVGVRAQAAAQKRGWWDATGPVRVFFPLRKRNLRAVPWLINEKGEARVGHRSFLVDPPLASTDFEYESTDKHFKSSQFQVMIESLRSSLPSSALSP